MFEQQQSPHTHALSRLKLIIFQLLYMIGSHKFTNIHLLAIIQLLQPFISIYYYLNPIFTYLENMSYLQQFHDNIWPQIGIFIPSQSPIVSIILLLVFPCLLLLMIVMKYFIGYQYLLILTMELFILAYPLLFVMFVVDGVDLVVTNGYTGIGVILGIVHGVGALAALHMYGRKYKMLVDMPIIILIQLNINQYAILSFLILRLAYLYFFTSLTILKPFKLNFQFSLFLILLFCYFTTDTLTNYISFLLLLGTFTLSPFISICQHYLQLVHLQPSHYNNIFYQIEHLQEQQPTIFKLMFYQFLQQHINDCVDVHCKCRSLVMIRQGKELKEKALEVMDRLFAFRQDYESLVEYATICCTHFGHRLSGLIPIYTNPSQSLYQQYTSYSIITSYQQQYRQGDRNYHFGSPYNTFYQDLRLFQHKIESISITLKQFWLTILEFDGSRKFLSMILEISQQINQITKLFDLYVDKYDEYHGYFLYLYKTFQLVILNWRENDDLGLSMIEGDQHMKSEVGFKQHLTSLTRQEKVTVPQRMPFFVSNQASMIINCNRQFCNLVQIDREQLLQKSYGMFVPRYCQQKHKQWVEGWFRQCYKDKEFTQSIKTIQLDQSGFIKSSRILTKIFPRFDQTLQTITFVKIINELSSLSHLGLHQYSTTPTTTKVTTYQSPQQRDNNNTIDDDFFSILIESQSMKIAAIDESFFACVNIQQSQQSYKRVISLRLSQIFPKLLHHNLVGGNQQGHHKEHHVKEEEITIEKQIWQSHGDNVTKLEARQKGHKNQKHENKHNKRKSIQQIKSHSLISSVSTQSNIYPKQVILNQSILQQFILTPLKHPKPPQISSNSAFYNSVSNPTIPPQPISSYNKLKPYTQSKQLIFNYQIIPQQNISMQIKYSIVHFKRKQRDGQKGHRNALHNLAVIQSLNYHNPHITMRRNRLSDDKIGLDSGVLIKSNQYIGGIASKRSLGKVSINSKISDHFNSHMGDNIISKKPNSIHYGEHSSSIIASNAGFQESLIRSSKSQGRNTVDNNNNVQSSSSSQPNQSAASLSSQKNYCLPFPLILPLIITHILYISATSHHSATLQYLNQTFTFYDMYQITILKQLSQFYNLGIFQHIDYLSSMKQLWMEGYGFYQNSFLVFQNHVANDEHLTSELFMTIISQNQYNIYKGIVGAFGQQQQTIYILYLAIMITLAGFIVYILVDFTLNLHYCFSVSSQVTDIILIFLNVSQKDINKLILSIQHYQENVLEINDFATIRKMMKKERDSYNLNEKEQGDMSGLALFKRNAYGNNNSVVDNNNSVSFKQTGGGGVYIDSIISSQLQNPNLIKPPINNAFIQNQPLSRPSTINYNIRKFGNIEQNIFRLGTFKRRKTTKTEKMNIDRLRATLGFLNEESENEGEDFIVQRGVGSQLYESNIGLKHQQQPQQFINMSGVSSIVESINQLAHPYNKRLLPSRRRTHRTTHPQPQLTQQQLSKLEKISKFKSRFRGRLNDIKQHPYLYAILFISLVIAMIVMIVSMVIVPQYLTTIQTLQQRYFDLRVMKMIVYKQMIQKISKDKINVVLQPNITSSVYGQGFYNNVRNTLNALPVFQNFWANVYTDDNCPLLVWNSEEYARCLSIGANITSFGQKVMLQYIEDLLGRLTVQQLFVNSSSSLSSPSNPITSTLFLNVITLQIDIISQGQSLMRQQISQYFKSVKNFQIILVIVGTLMLGVCILLSRRALKGILAKIRDGQNLLLVMPESIKNKYIGSVKKTKSIQEIKELQVKQRLLRQRREKRLATLMKISNKSNISSVSNNVNNISRPPLPPISAYTKSPPEQQAQQSSINLIHHRYPSSLPDPGQQQALRQALKNRPQLKLNSDSSSSHNFSNNKDLKNKVKVEQR